MLRRKGCGGGGTSRRRGALRASPPSRAAAGSSRRQGAPWGTPAGRRRGLSLLPGSAMGLAVASGRPARHSWPQLRRLVGSCGTWRARSPAPERRRPCRAAVTPWLCPGSALHTARPRCQEVPLTCERYGLRRLPFSRLSRGDVAFFEGLLPGRACTNPEELTACNVDWLKSVRGKWGCWRFSAAKPRSSLLADPTQWVFLVGNRRAA